MPHGPMSRSAHLTYASQQYPQYPLHPLQQYPVPAFAPHPSQYFYLYPVFFSAPRPALQSTLQLPSHQVDYPSRQPTQHPPVHHRSVPPQQYTSHFRPPSGPDLLLTPPPSFGRRHGPPALSAAPPLKWRSPTVPVFTPPQTPSPPISPNPIKLKTGKIYYLPHSKCMPANSIV